MLTAKTIDAATSVLLLCSLFVVFNAIWRTSVRPAVCSGSANGDPFNKQTSQQSNAVNLRNNLDFWATFWVLPDNKLHSLQVTGMTEELNWRLKIETQFQTNTNNSRELSGRSFMETKTRSNITRGILLLHHVFDPGRSVLRQPQVEDPLHEHLSVAVKIQGVWITDDLIVCVGVQQHRHVAASRPYLISTEARRQDCTGVSGELLYHSLL